MIRRIGVVVVSSLLLFATSPVFAQPGGNPDWRGPMWGQGHMWGGGWAGGPHMILGPFMMLLALIGIVTLILWLVRAFSHGGFHRGHGMAGCPHCGHGVGPGHSALDILAERFARGEIDKTEFEDKKRLIGR